MISWRVVHFGLCTLLNNNATHLCDLCRLLSGLVENSTTCYQNNGKPPAGLVHTRSKFKAESDIMLVCGVRPGQMSSLMIKGLARILITTNKANILADANQQEAQYSLFGVTNL